MLVPSKLPALRVFIPCSLNTSLEWRLQGTVWIFPTFLPGSLYLPSSFQALENLWTFQGTSTWPVSTFLFCFVSAGLPTIWRDWRACLPICLLCTKHKVLKYCSLSLNEWLDLSVAEGLLSSSQVCLVWCLASSSSCCFPSQGLLLRWLPSCFRVAWDQYKAGRRMTEATPSSIFSFYSWFPVSPPAVVTGGWLEAGRISHHCLAGSNVGKWQSGHLACCPSCPFVIIETWKEDIVPLVQMRKPRNLLVV